MSTTQLHQEKIDRQPTIWTVPDALWQQIEPVLQLDPPTPRPGGPRRPSRPIFDALIYLARTGIQWSALPTDFPPSSTVHDRLKEWVANNAFQKSWSILLEHYDASIGIEWSWQSADGCIVKAPLGQKGDLGELQATGSNPTDRGKAGCKRHVLSDAKGIPLAVVLSGANRHDMKELESLLGAVVVSRPSVAEHEAGYVEALCLDKGYDYGLCREAAVRLQYEPHIKARGEEKVVEEGEVRHPARRWVVEAGHSWMNRFRRVLVRWEKKAEHYLAFVQLACCLIVWRKLAPVIG